MEDHAARESVALSYTYRLPLLNMQRIVKKKGTQRATLSEGHVYIETWWKDSVTTTESRTQICLTKKVQSPSVS